MSLLDRMQVDASERLGPSRTRKSTSTRGDRSPYARQDPLPKGDINAKWGHDLFPLEERLGDGSRTRAAPKYNTAPVARALAESTPAGTGLSIKGAGEQHNVIEVKGLVAGTTADDVKAIFSACGTITQATLVGPKQREEPTVRLVFKRSQDAHAARGRFDGQHADGRPLSVRIVGSNSATLGARIGHDVVQDGSVDALLDAAPGAGSKMRSDALVNDVRASIMVAPPGADPADYAPSTQPARGRGRGGRGGRGGRRAGGGRRRGAAGAGGMEIDS